MRKRLLGGVFLAALMAAVAILPIGPAAAAPNAFVAYASGGFVRIGTVDLGGGGAITDVGSTGLASTTSSVTGLALSPSGQLWGIDDFAPNNNLHRFNTTNGAVEFTVAITGATPSNVGMTFTSDGRLFVGSGNQLLQLNTTTGATTSVLTAPFASGVTGIAARCIDTAGTNQIFAIAAGAPGGAALYRADPQGAPPYTATTVGLLGAGAPVLNSPKLGFDSGGTLWGLNVTNGFIMTLNPTTGAATTGATVTGQGFGLAIAPTVCPAAPVTTTTTTPAATTTTAPAASPLSVSPRFAG